LASSSACSPPGQAKDERMEQAQASAPFCRQLLPELAPGTSEEVPSPHRL
jgi:hypothetical protein